LSRRKCYASTIETCFSGSLLDVGCGTGRDLEVFAQNCPDVVGVDLLDSMIGYAKERRPHIRFEVGDMRSFRLGRTVEAITSFGYAIANLHTNEDLDSAFATLAAHAEPSATVLILEVIDTRGDPAELMPTMFRIETARLTARAEATYDVDARRQLVTRRRTWTTSTGHREHDFVQFRLIYPMELEHYLTRHGFEVLEMASEPSHNGPTMFVIARYRGAH
jgi:trans-aconitate methyltransferase